MDSLRCCGPASEKRLLQALGEMGLRLGRGRPAPPQRRRRRRPKPYQPMRRPGERVQIDVKYTGLRGHWGTQLYQYTALDEFSRWRFLRFSQELTPQASLAFFEELRRSFPFPIECLQTDHGTEFTYACFPHVHAPHPFTQHLESQGVRHKLIRIATPWHNGKVERSHRTDEEDCYRRFHLRTLPQAHRRLANWNRRYNNHRPHGALGWRTPARMLDDYSQSLSQGVTHV